MKKSTLIFTLFTTIVFAILYSAMNNEVNSKPDGSPSARTGSPGDGATCQSSSCHAGPTPATMAGWITSNIPGAGYTSGTTYTITATITRPGHTRWGFEISPQNASGALLGTLIATNTTQTKLITSGKYITHTSAGNSGSNPKSWTFNWTAPAAGTGNVTFYGAFLAADNDGSESGDTTFVSTLLVSELSCATPAQPAAITGNTTVCPGASQTYSISPVSGATSYTWTLPGGWSGSSTTTSINTTAGASSGTLSVVAVNACGSSTARTLAVTVDGLAVSAASTNVSCNGANNGTATTTPSSGVTPYTYSWSPAGGTSSTASNLAPGTYTVTVTDGAGCTKTASTTIAQPSSLSLTTTSNAAACGNSNGSATVSVIGGTSGYTYSWNTTPVQTTASATNIPSGNYTVTVTDAHSCTATASVSVTGTAGPATSISNQVNVSCNGAATGSATVTVNGGTAPFGYAWSPSGGSAANATGLSAGTYTVTVTDANGCVTSSNCTITEPSAISLSSSSTDATCGNANGSTSVNATGGTSGYSYSWNSVPVQTTATATGLVAGNYTVTVTDANGCTATANSTVTDVAGPVATASVTADVNCFGGSDGSAQAGNSGGTLPFTYTWSPSGGTAANANNLTAGNYSVTITDANGCTSVASCIVIEPLEIILTTSTTNAGCGLSNGSASVVASGGTGVFTYSWNTVPVQTTAIATGVPAGAYVVTVTDGNGCSVTSGASVSNASGPSVTLASSVDVTCYGGSNGEATVNVTGGTAPYTYLWSPSGGSNTIASNLIAGNYDVTVTDDLGCVSVFSVTISEPAQLNANAGSDVSYCDGGSATIGGSPAGNGGVAPYTYLWSPATGLSSVTDSTPVATPGISTAYLLTVTDDHGCTATSSVSVTVNPLPSAPVINATTDTLFSTSSAAYQWYVDGTIITGATDQFWVAVQNGNYTVVVTDANGCTAESSPYAYNSTGVGYLLNETSLQVFPNPFSEQLTIVYDLNKESDVTIELINVIGEKVFEQFSANQGVGVHSLLMDAPGKGMAAGIYYLKINTGSGAMTKMLVKDN